MGWPAGRASYADFLPCLVLAPAAARSSSNWSISPVLGIGSHITRATRQARDNKRRSASDGLDVAHDVDSKPARVVAHFTLCRLVS